MSAVQAIICDTFIPGILDHFLAYMGYGVQQTQESVEPNRPNNLYDPLPGDYGARGEFDGCSTDYSAQAWVNRSRGWLALGLGFAALSCLFCTARKSA